MTSLSALEIERNNSFKSDDSVVSCAKRGAGDPKTSEKTKETLSLSLSLSLCLSLSTLTLKKKPKNSLNPS
jgi:hypothetical protein